MTRYVKQTLIAASAVLALTATAASAQTFPSDFSALDADNNGQVTFAEYAAVAMMSGLTTTAAAQQFTRMSAGDAIITAEEHSLALAFKDQPYALQNINGGADINYASTAPEFEPPVEVQDSPVMESEQIVVETPAPEIETIIEPVPEMTESTIAVTEPDITLQPMSPEIPATNDMEIEVPETEEAGDILLEDDVEPLPEG